MISALTTNNALLAAWEWASFQQDLGEWLTPERIEVAIRCAFLVFIALPVVLLVSTWLRRIVTRRLNAQRGLVVGKFIRYTGIAIITLIVANQLGFSLAPLLGAAGIVGLGLAFASQTSVSNIISGLFLIAEKPFLIGDAIEVNGITGVVLSIDTLSIKMRTFDNRFVRIPNETLIKTPVINITRFPVRRIDINVGVAYKEDLGKVQSVLMAVAKANPLCLMEPKPILIFQGYGASSLDFMFGVWATRENWLTLKNSIQREIKEAFDAEGIEIPFPHISIYKGEVTEPFPIVMEGKAGHRRGEDSKPDDA